MIQPLEITVIGSGASGLAAAFRLQQAGHRVRVLERSDRIGSQLRSRWDRGYLLDQGAGLLPDTHKHLLRIVEEAGMLDQVIAGRMIIGLPRDGKVHELNVEHPWRDLRRTKLVSPAAKVRLLRLAPTIARARREHEFDAIAGTSALGDQSAAEWSARRFGRDLSDGVIGASLRALQAVPPEASSVVELVSAMGQLVGAGLASFRDGIGTYPERLSGRFTVLAQAEALEVVEREDRVGLTWRDGAGREHDDRVDGVVLAVPAAEVVRLLPELDPWRSEFLAAVTGSAAITVNVATALAPPEISATLVPVPAGLHPFLAGVIFDHNKAPGRAPPGTGLLTLVALDEWSAAQSHTDDVAIGRELLNALEQVLPGVITDVQFLAVNRWATERHPIGHYRGLARLRELCQGDGRVQLAGGFHAPPSVESATAAGERAALRLLAASSRHRVEDGGRTAAMRRAAGRRHVEAS